MNHPMHGRNQRLLASFKLMNQAELGLNLNARKTRRQGFLNQMDNVLWDDLTDLIAPHHTKGKLSR